MIGIIIFIKNPKLGEVKTRIAKTEGDQRALEIYKQLLSYTKGVLLEVPNVNRYLYYASFVNTSDDWCPEYFNKNIQKEGNLGERMKSAFKDVFEICDKVLIIGSDCAQLKESHINHAISILDNMNIAMGPSLDGGYYLLGMDGYYPELFDDIKWSTETVMKDTVEKAKKQHLTVGLTEPLSDIDYIEDWEKYGL